MAKANLISTFLLGLGFIAAAASPASYRFLDHAHHGPHGPDTFSLIQTDHVREAALLQTEYPIAMGQNAEHKNNLYSLYGLDWKVTGLIWCCILALGVTTFKATLTSPDSLLARGCLGCFYIVLSAAMIESNKWLMVGGRYPYPIMLTSGHMLVSFVLANILRLICPSLFPAAQNLSITPKFCLKFLPIGIPFAMSLVCGNWAYKYLSVSFLQIMKQSNVVTIYIFSAMVGLEAMRRCSSIILLGVLTGAFLAIRGELHFVWFGFLLQTASSLSEATKVIMQSFLMSGESRLDPLTMVLFMAPACLIANLIPLFVLEGARFDEIAASFHAMWPIILINGVMAFVLNVTVAQCIKQLSAVGYLLAGIVKDICIIASSTWLLGESLTGVQVLGFVIALFCVAMYSIYKRNADCFEDDRLLYGFARVFGFEKVYIKLGFETAFDGEVAAIK
jgi:hypothetical protein